MRLFMRISDELRGGAEFEPTFRSRGQKMGRDGIEQFSSGVDQLRVRLFGNPDFNSSRCGSIEISNQRARSLLAMLCLFPGERFERALLCRLFWEMRFEEQARASLRQCLSFLRKALDPAGGPIIRSNRSQVWIEPESVSTDLDEVLAALKDTDLGVAADCLAIIGTRRLLEGPSWGDEFDTWLRRCRDETEARLSNGLKKAIEASSENGRSAKSVRLHAVWQARSAAGSVLYATGTDEKCRVAVLPFRYAKAGPRTGFLQKALAEDLTLQLARLPHLHVAGFSSALRFASSDDTPADIAEALHVHRLIRGRITEDGSNLVVSLEIVDGKDGETSALGQVRGSGEDIRSLQADLFHAVRTGLGHSGEGVAAPSSLSASRGVSKEAYELFLQGRALAVRSIGDQASTSAVQLLQKAVTIDPEFAEAWTALAEAHIAEVVFTACTDRIGETDRMASCARRAIELDPLQGHAHALLGIYHWTTGNVVAALEESFVAYDLEPNNPAVLCRLGCALQYCGYTERALPFLKRAVDRDPVHARNHSMLAMAHLNHGNLAAAISAAERMVALGFPPFWKAFAQSLAGDRAAAVDAYTNIKPSTRAVLRPPGDGAYSEEEFDAYLRVAARGVCSGREEDRLLYCHVLDHLHETYFDPYDLSIVQPAIWMGHAELVFRTLGTRRTPANIVALMSLWADVEPIAAIRRHEGFLSFATKLGMVEAWENFGWPESVARTG